MYKLRLTIDAIWAYLNQPITSKKKKDSVWKFKRFFYLYQLRLLENCWSQKCCYRNHDSRGRDEYQTGN